MTSLRESGHVHMTRTLFVGKVGEGAALGGLCKRRNDADANVAISVSLTGERRRWRIAAWWPAMGVPLGCVPGRRLSAGGLCWRFPPRWHLNYSLGGRRNERRQMREGSSLKRLLNQEFADSSLSKNYSWTIWWPLSLWKRVNGTKIATLVGVFLFIKLY